MARDCDPSTNISLNEHQCVIASKTVILRYELDTPGGIDETPNANVCSYALPNELRSCLSKDVT